MIDIILAAWRYKIFILTSIQNEFKARFSRSVLGGLWLILNPLALVAMYAVALSSVIAAKHPSIDSSFAYANYLTAGFLAWTLFTDTVSRCLNIFIENGNRMKKMLFPRICLPLIVSGSVMLNCFLLFICIVVIFSVLGNPPNLMYCWLPILFAITLGFGLGLGLMLGILNVFLRDLAQIVPIALQFGFWFTPIVYFPEHIPPAFQHLVVYNPMFHLVKGFQDIIMYGRAPQWDGIMVVGACSLLLLGGSLFLFRKASAEMVDVL